LQTISSNKYRLPHNSKGWYSIPAFVVKNKIIYCFAFFTGAAQCFPAFVGLHACAESVTFLDFSCAVKLFVNNSIVENKNKIEYFFMLFFYKYTST
jgi:hypothetical protein